MGNKRRTKKSERRKLLSDWSKRNRERQGNKCAICGATEHLNCHHLIPKEKFPAFQYEDWNAIVLCARHHKFGKYSAHGNPIWFSEWLRQKRPEDYQRILLALELTMTKEAIDDCLS